jgi:fatty acid desaturase
LDHKTFITSLPAERLAALSSLSDRPGLLHLAGHAACILLFGIWVAQGWLLWPLAMVALGICQCFLFTLQHETTHKTPFRNPKINEWVGRITGLIIMQPFEWFRYFHFAHHRYTNVPDKDPELIAGAKPVTRKAWLRYVSGLPYWIGMAKVLVNNALGNDPGEFVPERACDRVREEARRMLVIYALALASLLLTPFLFWVWILPSLLGQPFLRLYLLAEHGRCAHVTNMFENTRTIYPNRVVRFLAWNMPYHIEHHTLPQVPFHKLPELHDEMQDYPRVLSNGYMEFTRDYRARLR